MYFSVVTNVAKLARVMDDLLWRGCEGRGQRIWPAWDRMDVKDWLNKETDCIMET